jgi:quercetin dioxygenase-like cupin family protein
LKVDEILSNVKGAVAAAPHMHRVIFENDRLLIVEYHGKPGDKAEMHSHPDGVIYHLEGKIRVRSTTLDGQVREMEIKPGDLMWSPAMAHALEFVEGDKCRGLHIGLK